MKSVAVIGGGPAGLRAAEVAASGGAKVTLFDAKASVGRKFLVAGKGGLNITKAEPLETFAAHYRGPDFPDVRWAEWLARFSPDHLREWALGLGIETFAASTGRVYPRAMKAAPLLRAWVQRLRGLGVTFCMHHRWTSFSPVPPLSLLFETAAGEVSFEADATIFALGGASWPETGSDGRWAEAFQHLGIATSPFHPANCGWEVDWPVGLLAKAEGQPLKNITASAQDTRAVGELMVTKYGLEGGAIYQLGPALRTMEKPVLTIDFKPAQTHEQLLAKMGPARRNLIEEARRRLKLSPAAASLLTYHDHRDTWSSPELIVAAIKRCPVALAGPRPIAEAISTAGGVTWPSLNEELMLTAFPGVFLAGEMIDWEAPTGGYLMQGCFASATHAANAALRWLESSG